MIIVVDVETSGQDTKKHAILSIGASVLGGTSSFYQECRLGFFDKIDPGALKVNGFTKENCTDPSKETALEIYNKFISWVKSQTSEKELILAGQQVGSFDVLFLKKACGKCSWPFSYRTIDIHSVAFTVFGKSLSLDSILEKLKLCRPVGGHNALSDAILEKQALELLLAYRK